jgi:hypothetical protein
MLHWNHLINTSEIRPIQVRGKIPKMEFLPANEILKTSLQIDSMTAKEFLIKFYPELHSDVIFASRNATKEAIIYFMSEQQQAINNPAKKMIICGVPGSGKSLVQMMRIYIAAQDRLRKNVKLVVIGATLHCNEYLEFLKLNSSSFVRDWTLFAASSIDVNPITFDGKEEIDLFSDEITPEQSPAYFSASHMCQKVTLALSSVHQDEHIIDDSIRSEYTIIELKTHFRCTKQIARFWQNHYFRDCQRQLAIGHNFDGIPIEFYTFDHIAECVCALKKRLRRLRDVEACALSDFAISFETRAEVRMIAETLRDNTYQFYLIKGEPPSFLQTPFTEKYNAIIASLIDEWRTEFRNSFHATAGRDADRARSLSTWIGLGLIILEVRNWNACCARLRQEIDCLLDAMLDELRQLCNEASKWRNSAEQTAIRLKRWEKLLSPHFDASSSFEYWEIHDIEHALPRLATAAGEILRQRHHECELFLQMADYFCQFRTHNTWPTMIEFDSLPSVQFPIQLVFVIKRAATIDVDDQPESSNYRNFLSIALSRQDIRFGLHKNFLRGIPLKFFVSKSTREMTIAIFRAQSHLIVFEFCQNDNNNEDDKVFLTKYL